MLLETSDNFTLINKTGSDIPNLSFESLKNSLLGKNYDLSLVFVGEARAQKLNIAYRDKTYIPDILSFPLSDTSGEIFICPKAATRKMKEFGDEFTGDFSDFLVFLFIHGLLHLKGMEHGSTMDEAEKKYFTQWQKTKQQSA